MSHYTLQMFEVKLTWRGRPRYYQLWTEDFDTLAKADVRGQELARAGYCWILHDWGTDPGPMPATLKSGVDEDDDAAWEYARAKRQFDRVNAKHDNVPF